MLLLTLALGALLAHPGFYGGVETGIALSLLAMAAMLLKPMRLPLLSALLIGVAGVFHSFAHGLEMAGSLAYVGFFASSISLLSLGFLTGRCLAHRMTRPLFGGILLTLGLWQLLAV